MRAESRDISSLKDDIAKTEPLRKIADATKPAQNEEAHIPIAKSIRMLVAEMTHIVSPKEREWPKDGSYRAMCRFLIWPNHL